MGKIHPSVKANVRRIGGNLDVLLLGSSRAIILNCPICLPLLTSSDGKNQ
jgi:hypothetical protein